MVGARGWQTGRLALAILALLIALGTAAPAGAATPAAIGAASSAAIGAAGFSPDIIGEIARGTGRGGAMGPTFGVTTHFMWHDSAQTSAEIARIAAAGFKTVRFDLGWRWVEPQRKGEYDAAVLAQLDGILAHLDARGIAPIITVIETPAWARPAGTDIFTPPTKRQDYADMLGMLAARHAVRTNLTWEVWNEPNLVEFWATGPNAAEYADLLKRAYRAVKAVAPGATVLGGSIVFNDQPFLRGMYAAGVAGHFDALAIHPYTGGRAPGDERDPWFSLRAQLAQMRAAMVAHGDAAKPLYVTEFGWSTDDVDDATRAAYLAEAVATMRGLSYVRSASVYTINQADYPSFGLVTAAGVETASWRAYVAATR